MDRHTPERRADVLADEAAGFRQLLDRAVGQDMGIGHFPPALGGKDEHRADAAVDVKAVVGQRRAGVIGQIVKHLLVLIQVLRQRLEHAGAVVKGQLAQGRPADPAGVVQHRTGIKAVLPGARDHPAGDGALYLARPGIGGDPFAGGIACDIQNAHAVCPCRKGWPGCLLTNRSVHATCIAMIPSEMRAP